MAKKQSSLEMILAGTWKVSSFFALMIFLVLFFLIPRLNSPVLSAYSQSLSIVGLVVIGLLMLISMSKLYQQTSAANLAKKYPLNQDTESPFAKTTLSEFTQRPTSWSLQVIQDIEWKRFEDLSMGYYLEKGILAKAASLEADGGIDIKLYQDGADNATSLVQCKAWGGKSVGVKVIRAFLDVLTHEKISKGFLMTTGDFTNEAKDVAKTNKINLINGEMLLSMIARLPEVSQKKLLTLAVAGDYKTPTCLACDVKMVKKENEDGAFWGCVNHSKCGQKMAVREGA